MTTTLPPVSIGAGSWLSDALRRAHAAVTLRPGRPLPPGTAACLAGCGWAPPSGMDLRAAALAHRDTAGHPTAYVSAPAGPVGRGVPPWADLLHHQTTRVPAISGTCAVSGDPPRTGRGVRTGPGARQCATPSGHVGVKRPGTRP
jgi:hypothetical protein